MNSSGALDELTKYGPESAGYFEPLVPMNCFGKVFFVNWSKWMPICKVSNKICPILVKAKVVSQMN